MQIKGIVEKVIRYGGSSAVALGIDVGLMMALINFVGMNYLYAAAIGFSAGCVANYILSKYFVFENRSDNSETHTVLLFFIVGFAGLLLNQLILYIGVDILSVHTLVAKAASAGIVFWFNFLLRGIFVFKDPDLCKTQIKQ
jgi:putative flippase GtrA